MNVQYFINKFQAIPEEQWCTGDFENELGQHCVNGHCGVRDVIISLFQPLYATFGRKTILTEESKALQLLVATLDVKADNRFTSYGMSGENKEYSVKAAIINNGDSQKYQQETPKQRILAALNDILLLEEQDKAVEQTNKVLEMGQVLEEVVDLW